MRGYEAEEKEKIESPGPDFIDLHTKKHRKDPVSFVEQWVPEQKWNENIEFPEEINFFFCIKHANGGKIQSHQFFFEGFCTYFNPDHC